MGSPTKNRKELLEGVIANFQAMKNKMHTNMNQDAAASHVTHSQLFALAVIAKNADIGVKELAKKLHISPSAATQLVDALVEKTYVKRKTSEEDRRALKLVLSPKGQKHISKLKEAHLNKIKTLFNYLSEEELYQYLKIQEKILTKMNEKK